MNINSNRDSFSETYASANDLIITTLLANASYLMCGYVCFNYSGSEGSPRIYNRIMLTLYNSTYYDTANLITRMSIGNGDINCFQNFEYLFSFCIPIFGQTKIYYSITTGTSNIGNWEYIGLKNVRFIRLT